MNPFLHPRQQENLVLASRSPRRIELMRGLGFEFEIDPAPEHIEDGVETEDPFAIPQLLAARKCEHVSEKRPASQRMKHLRQRGAHALAGACSQNDDVHGIGERMRYKVRDFSMRQALQSPTHLCPAATRHR